MVQNNDWIVVVPWWATWPFETLLVPLRHVIRMCGMGMVNRLLAATLSFIAGSWLGLAAVVFRLKPVVLLSVSSHAGHWSWWCDRFDGRGDPLVGRNNETANDQVRQLVPHQLSLLDGLARSPYWSQGQFRPSTLAVARHVLSSSASFLHSQKVHGRVRRTSYVLVVYYNS